jgi:hypothetical protein
MTAGSETYQGAVSMTAGLLSAKTHLKFGCWNVRTMFDTGKTAQVAREMQTNRLHILGISECRWTGFGSVKTRDGETILYSGRDDGKHQAGVALMLKKGVEKSLIDWKPINERMLRARFSGRHGKLTIIQCYAPTNDAEEEVKDQFYSVLQQETTKTPSHDLLIVMGDLNAKVGKENKGYDLVMGIQGCGVMNENGERLASFCGENNLVIGGTVFQHKEIHKLTWESPNGRDRNQIDHVMINRRWRGSLQDVRVKRGADVGSDHHLVVGKLKIKLRRTDTPPKQLKRFNISKLKDANIRQEFNIQLKNRFETLAVQSNNIEEDWNQLADTYRSCAKEVLGYKRKKDKEWLREDTWRAIEERKKMKAKISECKSERLKARQRERYQQSNTRVKRLARRDKRLHLEELAKEAEDAAGRRELSNLYRITKEICGQGHAANIPIKDKAGNLLATEKDQDRRWKEHFEEVLNRPEPLVTADIKDPDKALDINTEPPTKEEIVHAIKTLKSGKAPGHDQLNAELLKADPATSAKRLHPIFRSIWEEENIPEDWRKGSIVKIPKKGNLAECGNWRGITLLSIPSKVMCKIIIQRIEPALDKILRKEQCGFRKGRGCTDHIFALKNILEQSSEWQRELYISFIDYEKAFDSLHRESLWKILKSYGIPDKIIQVIKQFYSNFSCTVGTSDMSFQVKSGVRQGCVMSGLLFIIAVDWVLSRSTEGCRRGIRWTPFTQLEDLDYADDLALLSHSERHIQEKTNKVSEFGEQIGLRINIKKTKLLTVNVKRKVNIQVNDETMEEVEQFTYLGSVVSKDGGTQVDIQSRMGKARGVFARLNPIWRSRQYGRDTKIKIYQSCVIPVLLYSSECWRMTKSDSMKLAAFHTRCLRKICRIFWPNKISNENLFKITRQEDIRTTIKRRRWRWIGHAMRRDRDNIARTALTWTPEGRRGRGRPRTTWRRTVEAEAQMLNLSWRDLERQATDRHRWSDLVTALCAADGRQEPE